MGRVRQFMTQRKRCSCRHCWPSGEFSRLRSAVGKLVFVPPDLDGSETVGTRIDGDELSPEAPPRQIGRFAVLGKLGQGGMGVVFLGHDAELERKIAIKLLRSNATQTLGVRRLVREAQGLARLSHPNVIQVHEIGEHDGSMFVAMEYVEGSTLRDWLDGEPQPWRRALEMIRQAGRGLEAAHAVGLVHRDFKPSNVMVGKDGRARVLDFGLARASGSAVDEVSGRELPSHPSEQPWSSETLGDSGIVDQVTTALTQSGAILGTPAYMAPEQMQGRPCDPLSDQFSFCVCAYEALFGRRPFVGATLGELAGNVACGSIQPIPAESPVPTWLQQAVLRGLAAEPDRRWPSMTALLEEIDGLITMADLQAYLDKMREAGAGELLESQIARSDRFRLPDRLYGRESQLEVLVEAFERTSVEQPQAQLVLVSGPAGIGKSSLIERLRPIVEAKAGLMCAGSFNTQRATPLAGIVEALDDLVGKIEELDFSTQLRLRRELSVAVGRNARLLTELAPASARLLEDPQAIGELRSIERDDHLPTSSTPSARRNRLHLVVGRFLAAIASPKHPVVVFVDDLQWIDEPSLALLQHLLSGTAQQAVLLIGAHRSDDVGVGHPLHETLAKLESAGVSIVTLELEALSLADAEALLVDTLGSDHQTVREFAALARGKTGGNPFFLRQLLRTLHDEGLFEFDAEAQIWRWDLEQIAECSAFEDIHEVLRRSLAGLPLASRELIRIAACAGYRVALRVLALASERAPLEVFSELSPALEQGLLLIEGGLLDQVDVVDSDVLEDAVGGVVVRFGHALVQQAALASIAPTERTRVHLNIGRILRRRLDEHGQFIPFEVADHLNAGRTMIDPDERADLIELNLQCGRRAIESAAFASALEYLEIASELLSADAATSEHAAWFAVALERGRALTFDGSYEDAARCYRALLDEVVDGRERLLVHVAEIELALLTMDYASGFAALRRGFAVLGIDVPERDVDARGMYLAEFEEFERNLAGRSPPSLAELPDIEDQDPFLVLHGLGSNMSLVAGHRNVNGWIVTRTANMFLRAGRNSKAATVAYGRMATLLVEHGKFDLAQQFGELAIMLCRRFDDPSTTGRAMIGYLGFAACYDRPVLQLLPHFEGVFDKCLEGGDLLYAGYHLLLPQYYRLVGGVPLSEVMAEVTAHLPFLRRSVPGMLSAFYLPNIVLTTCTLMDVPLAELGLSFDHRTHVESFGRLPFVLGWYYSALSKLDYLLGRYGDPDEIVHRIEVVEIGVRGHLQVHESRYYAILTLLDRTMEGSLNHGKARALIDTWRADLARCAARCPSNFRHKHLLVEAELAGAGGGSLDQAISLYEQAIDDAREHGVIDQEALACRRFAEFWRTHGSTRTASIYFETARELYERWGARRLVRVIEELAKPGRGR